mmetsp:Transcript_1641/g.2883  ORF Transcript_1641/g.2883 Transcript_1641/m.2883 type:complete len:406 (+) Transcript_1641:3-1220(+)
MLDRMYPPSYFIAKVGSPAALANLVKVDEMALAGTYPVLSDLIPALYVAALLCVVRWALHRCMFRPLAVAALKLEEVVLNCRDHRVESAYKKNKKPSDAALTKLLKELNDDSLDLYALQQEFWLRRRRDSQELRITKFVEALWRCIFYTFFTLVGFFTLYWPVPVPWVKSPLLYFDHWPVEPLDMAVQSYYLMELGSYIHQLLWTDVSRSDSVEMMAHHIITILLISFSYVFSFMRIGTIIMAIHDLPDVFLEAGKCMNYIGKAKGGKWMSPYTDVMFGIFATLFFVTRIVIYPYMVLTANTVCHKAFGEGNTPSYLFFIGLLAALQFLHWFWFYLIIRMAYRLLWLNGGTEDIRSDDDDEDELETPVVAKKKAKVTPPSDEDASSPAATVRRRRSTRSTTKKEM